MVMTETKAIQEAMLKSWGKTEPIDKEVEVIYKGEKPTGDTDVSAAHRCRSSSFSAKFVTQWN